jgi:hypothetical protein
MCHSTDNTSVYDTTFDTVKVIGTPKNTGQIDAFKIKTDVLSVDENSFRFTSLKKLTLHYTELLVSGGECLYLPTVEELKLNFTHHGTLIDFHSVETCVLNFKLCAPNLKVLHLTHEYIDTPLFDKSFVNLNFMLEHCEKLELIKFDPNLEHVYETIDFTFKMVIMFDQLIEYADRCNIFATLHAYTDEGLNVADTIDLKRIKQIEEKAIKYGYISGDCPVSLQKIGETEEQSFERLLNEYQIELENYEEKVHNATHNEQDLDGFDIEYDDEQPAKNIKYTVQKKIDTIRENYKKHPDLFGITTCYAFCDSRFEALSECFGSLI